MLRTRSRLFVLGLIWAVAALPLQIVGAAPTRQDAPAPRADSTLAPSAPAGGTVGSGPGTCIEAALDTALAGGGTVTFNCGGPATILILSQKTITQSTTIDGGGLITITGGLATRLFHVHPGASLSLRDIVLDSGAVNGTNGGAIDNEGALSLERTTIQYSQTSIGQSGGAISTTGPTYIHDSQLLHNTAGSGGALHANGGSQVVIDSSVFQFNHAVDNVHPNLALGGAIHVRIFADVTILNSSVSHNDTEGSGGAVYSQGRLTSGGNVYLGNETTQDPGASFLGYGGAIASTGPITITNDTLHANYSRFGGGLFLGGTVGSTNLARVSNTQFTRNEVVYSGGGLYTSSDTTELTVTDSLFGGNEAAVGGGLSRNNTTLSVYRSTFGQNQAESGGGLVSSAGPGLGVEVKVYDSTFYSNVVTSVQGGAIYNQALIELRNLTLEGNTTGVFNSGSGEVMQIANTVLHNVGTNCDGDGTQPQSLGGNFSSDNSSCGLSASGDVHGAALDPLLGPLIEMVLPPAHFFIPLPGSPLINMATVPCSLLDQRRAYRPDACDKGAVEYGGLLPQIFLPLLLRSP